MDSSIQNQVLTAPIPQFPLIGFTRQEDPFLERERAAYAQPLPSREWIIQVLEHYAVPVPEEALIGHFAILPHEMDLFLRRIRAMERDGQLLRNRNRDLCLVSHLDLIQGTVLGHPDGFGFVQPEDGSADMTLSAKEMRKVMHGDGVRIRVVGEDRRGRREAQIVELISSANTRIVGRLQEKSGLQFVVPENRRITQELHLTPGGVGSAQVGQVVLFELITPPTAHTPPVGHIVEVLGTYADAGMEIEIAIRKHGLPRDFPPEVEQKAKRMANQVLPEDIAGREDVRSLPLVTIDGETSRDFDDAVYAEPNEKGFRLVVAIADVSHYVRPGDVLDGEAISRGNSVYFPRRVIPMLPEELSNGLCSLNQNVDRLCLVCDMQISEGGNVDAYRFYPSVMHSRARLTYTQVADMLKNPRGEVAQSLEGLQQHVNHLYQVYRELLVAREVRGAIDFGSDETRMIFTPQGKIEKIVPVVRNEAHKLIEECMLAANVCAAHFLKTQGHAGLFRAHAGPDPERLAHLREFLQSFGVDLKGDDFPQVSDFTKVLREIAGRPEESLLQAVLLRSMRRASYTPERLGHFGLGYETYTHFTSPIRRYPDLLVHRAIKSILQGKVYTPEMSWEKLGVQCSQTERRADQATRDVDAWLKCFYMQDHLGLEFDGVISSVVGFGLFVTLDGLYTEGLVHVSELGKDYFHFDSIQHTIKGEKTGKSYRLGDRIKVKVSRVDLDNAKIELGLADIQI